MIQKYVDMFIAAKPTLEVEFKAKRPDNYDFLVERLINILASESDNYGRPDPTRITTIDHGEYQGTRLFIIGAEGYQPADYWIICVQYGSCSGCDTFEANRDWQDEITDREVQGNIDMMLHMVQSMKKIAGYDVNE